MFKSLFHRRDRPDEGSPRPEYDGLQVWESKRVGLEDAIIKQIVLYKQWARENDKKARRYHTTAAVLGAVVTVLLGLELDGSPLEPWLPRVAFLLSALLTALASVEAFQDPRGQTVRSLSTYLQLLQLRARYQYDMAPPTSGAQEEIVERYWKHLQELLSTEHTQRIEALGKPKESSKSG